MDSFFKLLRKLLKVELPTALSSSGWEEWTTNFKSTRPVAFFLTETLENWCQKLPSISDRWNDFRYYIYYGFSVKSHIIPTGLERGRYHEVHSRLLHGNFQVLVDFVELECASYHARMSETQVKDPFWHHYWFLRFKKWRNQDMGITYLYWCMTLDWPDEKDRHPPQAEQAREVFELYKWWKYDRDKRPDPFEEYNKFSELMDQKYGKDSWFFGEGLTADELKEQSRCFAVAHQIEEDQAKEDDENLHRLINVSRGMWT